MIQINDCVSYDSVKNIWSGTHKASMYSSNVSIGQVILSALLKNPEKIAQINDNNGVTITNDTLYMKIIRSIQNLMKLGYKKGDTIGIVSGNHHELSAIAVAALTLCTPVIVLHSAFTVDEICTLFGQTKPKIIFCTSTNTDIIQEVIRKLELNIRMYIFGSESINEIFAATGIEDNFIPPDIEDGTKFPALFLCTSGTSGFPKCLGLPHALLLDDSIPVSNNGVIFSFSTLYWYTGWSYLINGFINGCTRIITTESFEPSLMLRIISKYKVTNLLSPPANIAAFLQLDHTQLMNLNNLKSICLSGSITPISIIMQLKKIFPNTTIRNCYGMSETGTIATSTSEHPNGSVGIIKNGTKVKIVDDNGRKLGPCINGEILRKAPYTFLGYVGNEKATNETLDSDGWTHTGDIGHFDDNGYLYVVDRKKDLLKYKNYQISPSEIEKIIQKTFKITNVCVVGIPDIEIGSDLPTAFVIKSADSTTIVEHDIKKLIAENLSDAKQLRGGVHFIDVFPTTPTGKVLRRELREMAIKLYSEKKK